MPYIIDIRIGRERGSERAKANRPRCSLLWWTHINAKCYTREQHQVWTDARCRENNELNESDIVAEHN